jgi:hypothetical protein
MPDTLAKELNRCASEAQRLLDSSLAPDRKASLLSSAARVLAATKSDQLSETAHCIG